MLRERFSRGFSRMFRNFANRSVPPRSGLPSVSNTIEMGFRISFFESSMSAIWAKKALKSVKAFSFSLSFGKRSRSCASISSTVRSWNVWMGKRVFASPFFTPPIDPTNMEFGISMPPSPFRCAWMYRARNSMESSKYLPSMKEPLISTPMKRTRRPAGGRSEPVGAAATPAERRTGARRVTRITARERARMSGRLPDARVVQLCDQQARVLEVLYLLKGQVDEVPVRDEERDEVERRRDNLHRRHEEGFQEALTFRANPLELIPELAREILGKESEGGASFACGVTVANPLALNDRHHRRRPDGREQEPGQTA